MNSIKDILQVEEGEKYACEGQRYPSTAEDPNIPDCLLHARYNRLLPIYVIPDQKRVISGSLKWLSKMSGVESISFMFYDLIFLFQRLLDASPFDIPHKVSYGAAEAHLMRDVYLYLSNVSCRYNFRIYFLLKDYLIVFPPFSGTTRRQNPVNAQVAEPQDMHTSFLTFGTILYFHIDTFF